MRALIRLVATAALLLAGCARATTQGSGAAADRGPRNVLTQEQLAATNAETLYDAIVRLRPEWLSSRGPTSVTDATPTLASVFMNGNALGKAERLRDMHVNDVTEVRYWDAASASARFGMGHPRGVIELTRK